MGSAICEKAVKLDSMAVVLSKHTKSVTDEYWLEFYVGSVTEYCKSIIDIKWHSPLLHGVLYGKHDM